jgi:hypothetical protein
MAGEQEIREQRLRDLLRPTEYLRSLGAVAAALESTRSGLGGGVYDETSRRIREEVERWSVTERWLDEQVRTQRWLDEQALSRRNLETSLLGFSMAAYESSLSHVLRTIEQRHALDRQGTLGALLLQPLHSYSEYARDAVTRHSEAAEPMEMAVTEAGVTLAASQVEEGSELMAALAKENTGGDSEGDRGYGLVEAAETGLIVPIQTPIRGFFLAQEAELRANGLVLVSAPRVSVHLDDLSQHAKRARVQREFARLIHACNEAAQFRGDSQVFIPSNQLLLYFNELGWIHAEDRDGLGKLVDCLFFALYEAGGKSQPRYRKYLRIDDCGVVEVVTQLRHKILRHDIEQGAAQGLPFQWQDLAEAVGLLGAEWLPYTAEEHLAIHDRLLGAAIDFLQALLAAIRTRAPSAR